MVFTVGVGEMLMCVSIWSFLRYKKITIDHLKNVFVQAKNTTSRYNHRSKNAHGTLSYTTHLGTCLHSAHNTPTQWKTQVGKTSLIESTCLVWFAYFFQLRALCEVPLHRWAPWALSTYNPDSELDGPVDLQTLQSSASQEMLRTLQSPKKARVQMCCEPEVRQKHLSQMKVHALFWGFVW